MKTSCSYLIRPVFRVALVALMVSLPVGLAAAGEAPPEFLTAWGSEGTGNGEFYCPYGVAVDGDGNVYVADTVNNRIQKFDADGNYLTRWGSLGSGDGQFNNPYGIAVMTVDSVTNVYVADTVNNRIQKFDADGNYLTQWGSPGSGDGQFSYPKGIAVDGATNVYVADWYRVQKFKAGGTFLAQWGESGTAEGEFFYPTGIAVDGAGNFYVADTYNRIQKFGADGTFLTQWGSNDGSNGTGEGEFFYPTGIAVDGAGNVYVADTVNSRVQKFGGDGNYLTQWGSEGEGEGQFSYPDGVAVDGAGNVYVADTFNNRIQKFVYPFIDLGIDIRPRSCRNHLNMRSRGVLPVAILGSEDFDVRTIDVSTVTLSLEGAEQGATPIRSRYADVSGPLEAESCDRDELGPDGYEDLVLKFRTRDVARTVRALGEVNNGDEVVLTVRGNVEDETQFEGEDSVKIIGKECKKGHKWGRLKGRKK